METRRLYATLAPLMLALLIPVCLNAQTVVRGRILTATGEAVAGAAVSLERASDRGLVNATATDSTGQFAFAGVPPGNFVVRVQRIGFFTQERPITVGRTAVAADFQLVEEPVAIESVTVEGQRERARFQTEAGVTRRELSRNELKLIPGLAESDVLRAVEALPGVVATSDFSSSFNVRGGSSDQNLIQLDGIPIYNPFHVGGLFSVFNSDMIQRAELLAGGFPAKYGGRVSSVLNVISDVGEEGLHVSGGVSVLATRIAAGADLPGNGRIRLGARRSYFDQLLKPFFDFPYHLNDLQLASEWWTDANSRLSLTAYMGDDVLNFAGVDSFPLQLDWKWGNRVAGVAWNRTLANGGALDVRSSYSRFDTQIHFPDFSDTRFGSNVQHALARANVTLPLGRNVIEVGAELNRMFYNNRVEAGGTVFRQSDGNAWQPALFAQITWKPNAAWLIETGLREDMFVTSSIPTIADLSPRLAVKRFFRDGDAAFKLALGRYTQYIHSLRDEELPLGIDVWVLSGSRAPRVVSDQVQAGFEWFPSAGWYAAVESYYRRFDGVATNNFADDPNDPTDDLLAGKGLSYGGDAVVRKDEGPVSGFVTFSWLRAWREFPDFLTGLEDLPAIRYPPLFDRRVEVDLVLRFELKRGWNAGLRWNYGSGLPYTRPIGSYAFHEYGVTEGKRDFREEDAEMVGVILADRNSSRYPAYHRLDVSFRKPFTKRWGTITPHIDILNVYNRKNVLFYIYDYNTTPATRGGSSMFPFLPTAGMEVTF